jgi:hypothetical protein
LCHHSPLQPDTIYSELGLENGKFSGMPTVATIDVCHPCYKGYFQKLSLPCCAIGKLGKLKGPGGWTANVGAKTQIAEEGCTKVKTNSQMYIVLQNKFIYSHPCLKERGNKWTFVTLYTPCIKKTVHQILLHHQC